MELESRTMKKIFIFAILTITLLSASWGFYSFGTGIWFKEYITESDFRRRHPDILPSPIVIKMFDMWHSTSYASIIWIQFIQYIADNLQWNKYLDFSHAILEQITILHPYFTKPYEMDLILTPFSRAENQTIEQKRKNKILTGKAIELWKKWMKLFCDEEKIEKIKQQKIWEELWNNQTLRNPCTNGMIPYFVAFATYQMGDNKAQASEYYKIASMNNDAPIASRQLGIIALAAEWDFRSSALNFALVGADGYDSDPYICRNFANRIISDLASNRLLNTNWIDELEKNEISLIDTRDSKNPNSQSNNNCYDMTKHSIKALYLWYITDIASGSTAKNGDDLIRLWLIKSIPTISTLTGYTVRKIDGIWEYSQRFNK